MTKAPITLDTELETSGDYYETASGLILPDRSTGQVLQLEEDRVLVEWCYTYSDVPWASEYYATEWIDLDNWAAWVALGFEEPEDA